MSGWKLPLQLVKNTVPSGSNSSVHSTLVSPARSALNDNDTCSVSDKSFISFRTALTAVDSGLSLCSVTDAQYIKVNNGAGSVVLNSHPSHLTFGPRSSFYAQFPASTSVALSTSSCSSSLYSYTSLKPWQKNDARSLRAYPSKESLTSYTSLSRTPSSLHSSSSQLSLTGRPRVRLSSNLRGSARPRAS